MNKKILSIFSFLVLSIILFSGCTTKNSELYKKDISESIVEVDLTIVGELWSFHETISDQNVSYQKEDSIKTTKINSSYSDYIRLSSINISKFYYYEDSIFSLQKRKVENTSLKVVEFYFEIPAFLLLLHVDYLLLSLATTNPNFVIVNEVGNWFYREDFPEEIFLSIQKYNVYHLILGLVIEWESY